MREPTTIRLNEAREQARILEDAILQARELYSDADGRGLAAYLKSVVDQLFTLRDQIDTELGFDALRSATATCWLRLSGGKVGEGRAPVHLVGKVLEALQTGVRQAAGFIETGSAVVHRIPRHVKDESALDFVAFARGSARIAVAPAVPQLRVDRPLPLADAALQQLFAVAAWAEGEAGDDQLEKLLPDPTIRRQMLSRIKELAPSTSADFAVLEISGLVVAPVASHAGLQITPRAFGHASGFLRRRQEEPASFGGQLVAIDIEKGLFDLRHGRRRIHCYFPDELLSSAKALIEAFVEVKGVGTFHYDDELPYRIAVTSLSKLSPEEQARLP